ncbi:MAG: hypothetical protein ACHQ1D_06955 [Nitrososphaerales archaeon]
MRNSKGFIILLLFLLVILVGVYWFRTEWREKLTSDDGHLTVAHVYSSYKTKATRYYSYVYKVGNDYYSASTSGSNVDHAGDSLNLQFFPVSFYAKDPKMHTVIWSYKFNTAIQLGIKLDSLNLDKALIKKHTSFGNGVSPTADKNDERSIESYQMITGNNLK